MRRAADHIVFPLDVPTMEAAEGFVKQLAGCVGMFKVGLELFVQCGPPVIEMVRRHSNARIFLDLKLHDIPATVSQAMARIAGYGVDLVTVHCGEGRAMLEAAAAAAEARVRVLAVTVLTSITAADLAEAGFRDPFSRDVFELVIHRAEQAKAAGCAGVVCSGREVGAVKERLGEGFLAAAPGIRPAFEACGPEDDQKRVVTPAKAIADGADYLVIGRPIRDAADPAAAARRIGEEIQAALESRAAGPAKRR